MGMDVSRDHPPTDVTNQEDDGSSAKRLQKLGAVQLAQAKVQLRSKHINFWSPEITWEWADEQSYLEQSKAVKAIKEGGINGFILKSMSFDDMRTEFELKKGPARRLYHSIQKLSATPVPPPDPKADCEANHGDC